MAVRRLPGLARLGAVLAFAALALGSGLDRASAKDPRLARYVPGFLASEALRVEATQFLQAGDSGKTIAFAKQAVLADPIHPRSTALLGAGHLAARQNVLAERDFRIAARFGWRDPLTQIYFMNAALAGGQPRLAALRLDAVLRQAPNLPVREMLLAQFEASEAGRAALAERLLLRPAWTSAFLGDHNILTPEVLEKRAAIVAGLPGPRWGCDEVAPLVGRLVLAGSVPAAKALWQAQCPSAVAGVADPHFAGLNLSRQPVAFEWNLIGSGDISATPTTPAGRGLLIRLSGPSSQPVGWQMLALAAGQYRLSWTAATSAGESAQNLSLSLSCALSDRKPLAARSAGKGRFEADLDVDAACPGQFLSLWLAPGSEEVRFDNPVVTPR